MRKRDLVVLAFAGIVMFGVGCKKTLDKSAFKSTLDNYYSTRQECLWAAPVKFPAQADTSDDAETQGFDALTDAGLLTRKAVEKKRFLVGSKQVNDYDLSAQGRTVWTADPSQPGYGNFCYGHPSVTTVDAFTPSTTSTTEQYSVSYHYSISNVPTWANTTEMKTAFPKLSADTGPRAATATLAKSNDGWQVVNVQPVAPGY